MSRITSFHMSFQRLLRVGMVPALAGVCLLSLDAALLSGQATRSERQAPNPAHVTVLQAEQGLTFARDVAPIVQAKCETCHRDGSVAPMSLQTYEQVAAFAPLIRDRVSRGVMPPWPVDKTVGVQAFRDNESLSDGQIKTIVDWIDAGAPLGDPADLPERLVWNDDSNRWPYEDDIGRPPDLVLTAPMYTVEANGRDQWPQHYTSLEEVGGGSLTKERWIQAIGSRPADTDSRYVFHHANVSITDMPGNSPDPMGDETGSIKLIDTAVGTVGMIFPKNTGRVLRPGSQLRWNMHFHPYTRDMDAALQLGVWFYPEGEEPDHYSMGDVSLAAGQGTFTRGTFPASERVRHAQVSNEADILLPPNSVSSMRGYHVLDRPAMVSGLRGHMHLRGKYQIVEVVYPDGSWEVINKLNWDHAWHKLFLYEDGAEPLLPKGTTLILTSVFDNTVNNKHNPDPDQWVSLGDRSIDEMSHIRLEMTYFSDEDFAKMVDERAVKGQLVSEQQ
jgi:hypothetical protein